ncbi:uncharacterized protein LAESUDRAFT_737602 [Laetiporus sulphureus 93-53]|uniref:CCR4-NOT transcription complex subunit 11 n=1 Tax=Laetiporus sulphureus 93-53 TaxID=1314785 RepID=A0A165DN58_9APHY|nr:uncharacterized protein LAESUDRAFT_737602 [Laetiporus sulphureus 93-53]KZT05250.1 hypothetical protein LAESUDRAFT_737602 [Laetiporus sulphureus 93-53]
MKQPSVESARASVHQLLARAYSLPCSTAMQAFTQLVPISSRFQVALDVLLPLLDSSTDPAQRILVSYLLYALYAPYSIAINPFRSALLATFIKEREDAMQLAREGGSGEGEQLVWVLWKILKGDGDDIGIFTPMTLARGPLPPKLRAANLLLEDEEPYLGRFTEEANKTGASPVAPESDEETQRLSEAMTLLLAARERVLTLSEQRTLLPALPQLTSPPVLTSVDLPQLIAYNPTLVHPLLSALLSSAAVNDNDLMLYLDVLRHLPPSLPSFDLVGRLLRDPTPVMDSTTGGKTTIADLVRTEVLGWFIHECIAWLDRAEEQEREGSISDDRFAKGVQNLCRFYNSLIKFSIVDPASDIDSAEIMHFTLRNSRFEEANALYRVLATGKF